MFARIVTQAERTHMKMPKTQVTVATIHCIMCLQLMLTNSKITVVVILTLLTWVIFMGVERHLASTVALIIMIQIFTSDLWLWTLAMA